MKILHMISGGDTGGAKTHVFNLLSALSDKAEVKMVCFMKGSFYDELSQMPVESELIEQKSRFDLSCLKRLKEIIAEGYDIVHCHGARANFIAKHLKAQGIKVPFVTTIHSDYLLDFDTLYKKIVFTTLNVSALKKFDYYIAVSSNFKKMLISRGFRPNSVFTVYNGMDYSKPYSFDDKETFAKRIGITYDPNITYIGLIGRHDYVKGHDIFINAAKIIADKYENVRFIIAGDGDGREELSGLAKSLGISDKVVFCGFIKDIYSFINFIDINTLTSRCESFPYVLMEGARMKKPTVSSAVGGIPDLILDNECGLLFEKENAEDLAEKLEILLNDKKKAEMFGEKLYDRAINNFSNESLANSHIDIYRSILKDHYDNKKYDAAISGYYGFNNSGDDALLHSIISDLQSRKKDLRICVFSAKPQNTQLEYQVDSVNRLNFFKLASVLSKTKLLISGGGSLIQDATSEKSLWYYLEVMRMAKKYGAKLYIYANGIGPIKDENLIKAAKVLRSADKITLRDADSLNLLQKADSSICAEVTADPAISMYGERMENRSDKLCNTLPENKLTVGVSLREWKENEPGLYEKIAQSLDSFSEKFGAVTLFIPMKDPDDVSVSEKVSSMMKTESSVLKEHSGYENIMNTVSQMNIMVGMRLHSLVFAVSAGIPTVGISYDPKVKGFLDSVGIEYCVDSSRFDKQTFDSYLDHIGEKYDSERKRFCILKDDFTEKAKKNADYAIDLIVGGDKN